MLQAYAAAGTRADADVAMAQAGQRPDWAFEVEYGRRDPMFGDMVSVGARVRLPLFADQRQAPVIAARSADAARVRVEREAALRCTFEDGQVTLEAIGSEQAQATETIDCVLEGDEIVLDGVKAIVPGAESADLFVVSAAVDGVARLVIVEPGTEGLKVEDDPAMGLRAAKTARLHLEGVRVAKGDLLGTAEDHADAVRRARLAWAAAAVGTSQAVLDHVSEYVKERKAFGEPIGYRQAVAFTVSDIAIELAGLRLVVWKAAARLDRGEDASAEIAQARSLVSRHATWIGSSGVQLLGGHGFVKEFDNERWYRDLRGAGVLEGTLLV